MSISQAPLIEAHPYAVYHDLADKTVVITGGAGGIGAEMVSAFASQGSLVVFADIDQQGAEQTILRSQHSKHLPRFVLCDLSDIRSADELTDTILTQTGSIDVLVNNAANDKRIKFESETFYEDYTKSRVLNIDSPVFLTRAILLKAMIPASKGVIISISSIHAEMASDGALLPYGMSKSGLNHFVRWVSHTYGHYGIRSNGIEPGWIATDKQINEIMTPKDVGDVLAHQTVKRIGFTSDIANVTLFCASQSSSFVNGQILRCDGGRVGNYYARPVDAEHVEDPLTKRCLALRK